MFFKEQNLFMCTSILSLSFSDHFSSFLFLLFLYSGSFQYVALDQQNKYYRVGEWVRALVRNADSQASLQTYPIRNLSVGLRNRDF